MILVFWPVKLYLKRLNKYKAKTTSIKAKITSYSPKRLSYVKAPIYSKSVRVKSLDLFEKVKVLSYSQILKRHECENLANYASRRYRQSYASRSPKTIPIFRWSVSDGPHT